VTTETADPAAPPIDGPLDPGPVDPGPVDDPDGHPRPGVGLARPGGRVDTAPGAAIRGALRGIDPQQAELTDAQLAACVAAGIVRPDQTALPTPAEIRGLVDHADFLGYNVAAGEMVLMPTPEGNVKVTTLKALLRRAKEDGGYVGHTRIEFLRMVGDIPTWVDVWPPSWTEPPVAARAAAQVHVPGEGIVKTEATVYWENVVRTETRYETFTHEGRTITRPVGEGPTKFWQGQRGVHQLGKTVVAAAVREACPGQCAGLYIPEEMERASGEMADQARRARFEEGRAARAAEYRNRDQGPVADGEPVVVAESMSDAIRRLRTQVMQAEDPEDQRRAGMRSYLAARGAARTEEPDPEPEPDPAAPEPLNEAGAVLLLVEEIGFQAEQLGVPAAKLTARLSSVYPGGPDQWPSDALRQVVIALRPTVAARLRAAGRGVEADCYGSAPTDLVAPVEVLLGNETLL
jgi:hypothetical protein